ncbi:hypothetical protein ANN_10180 [Periplaneta americana]|uniref:Uncharacterized protein n=1 Tax=Periplaneta americana TaxID=6978 RepID=A0ABQ8TNL8_PERAM|nr:hypothetical protein ANN_10180 [Periplaneta americana]
MSPGSSTESYPAFARIGLRENPGKNLNQYVPGTEATPRHTSDLDHCTIEWAQFRLTAVPQVNDNRPSQTFLKCEVKVARVHDYTANTYQVNSRATVRPEELDQRRKVVVPSGIKPEIFQLYVAQDLSSVAIARNVYSRGALYGAETWTLRRSEEKQLEAFEMWIWRRMERVKWTDRTKNEAVLEKGDEERMMLKLIRKRKINWLGHLLKRNCLLKDALEGMVNGKRVRGRRTYQIIDYIKIYGSYETKRKTENRKDWRMLDVQ